MTPSMIILKIQCIISRGLDGFWIGKSLEDHPVFLVVGAEKFAEERGG